MSHSIWGGGANEAKPIDDTVAVIRAAGADIIGVQETRLESDPCTADLCPAAGPSVAQALADALGDLSTTKPRPTTRCGRTPS